MSNSDRILRLALAVVLAILNVSNIIPMPESILVWIMLVIFVLTAFTGSCPMYKLFGINTKDKRKYDNR